MVFRPLIRKNKELPTEECLELLRHEKRGVLAVLGDGGYPYAAPINHYYNDGDGKLYFHCGRAGHRLDALRNNDKACFTCTDGGTPIPGHWALEFRSVIVFGTVEIVDDAARLIAITTALSHKFTDDESYISEEIQRSGKAALLLVLTPEHISGKKVKES